MSWNAAVAGAAAFLVPGVEFGATPDREKCMNVVAVVAVVAVVVGAHGLNRLLVAAGAVFGRVTYYHYHYHYHSL